MDNIAQSVGDIQFNRYIRSIELANKYTIGIDLAKGNDCTSYHNKVEDNNENNM